MRKKVVTKDFLLEIAGNIIKEEDLKACSMRAVSRKAGIGVGTLYNYYSSREELLIDLFDKSWKQTMTDLAGISLEDLPLEKKFEKWCLHLTQEIKDRKGLGRAIYGDAIDVKKMNLENKNSVIQHMTSSVKNIMKDAEVNKELNNERLTLISEWVVLAVLTNVHRKSVSETELVDELMNRYIKG